jgi:Holliday junction resolvase RusA-like endonuclease
MQINITIEGPAYSINKMYYATRKILTKEARAWQDSVIAQLAKYDLPSVGPLIDQKPLRVDITLEYPKSTFYNKEGLISSRTYDCSNFEKSIIDVIFDLMGTNDKYIVELFSTKVVGNANRITFTIETMEDL